MMTNAFKFAELVDKCIGSRIHIVMKSDKEIVGTLLGFDDFVSILYMKHFQGINFCVCLFNAFTCVLSSFQPPNIFALTNMLLEVGNKKGMAFVMK